MDRTTLTYQITFKYSGESFQYTLFFFTNFCYICDNGGLDTANFKIGCNGRGHTHSSNFDFFLLYDIFCSKCCYTTSYYVWINDVRKTEFFLKQRSMGVATPSYQLIPYCFCSLFEFLHSAFKDSQQLTSVDLMQEFLVLPEM